MNPILKWAGGKRRLLQDIIALLPSDYKKRSYHEPFLGGGAVFYKIRPKSGTINDINPRLMNFYEVVRDNPVELIEMTSQYQYNEETYYKLRDRFNQPGLSKIEEASLLLYLNKTAYNGLYRVNSKGEFNVPYGRYYNPTIVPKRIILSASKIFKNVIIYCTDFTYIEKCANEGDICYLDPPYQPKSLTANFTSYSSDGFDYNDQVRLRNSCINLHEKGVSFVLSNAYVREILDLYNDINPFRIEIVKARRAISSKASTRGPVKEVLVTNIPKNISQGKKSYPHERILFYYGVRQ